MLAMMVEEVMSTTKNVQEPWLEADENMLERLMQLCDEVWNEGNEPSTEIIATPDGRLVLRQFLKDH